MARLNFKKKYDDPSNLPELEQRRWNAHLRFLNLVEKEWKPLSAQIKKMNKIYGYDKKGDRWYFEDTDYGFTHDHINTVNGYKRACMLEDDELPLHINDPDEECVEFVKKRLSGELKKAIQRDDLVQKFFKIEQMTKYCDYFKELSLKVIEEHAREMERYSIEKNNYKLITPHINLDINGRLYIWMKDKFIVKPDDVQDSFSINDMKKAYGKLKRYESIFISKPLRKKRGK